MFPFQAGHFHYRNNISAEHCQYQIASCRQQGHSRNRKNNHRSFREHCNSLFQDDLSCRNSSQLPYHQAL